MEAKWRLIDYQITYVTNYDDLDSFITNNNPTDFNIENQIVLNNPTLRQGFVFEGWYLDSAYTTKIVQIEAGTFCESLTLYGKWNFTGTKIYSKSDFAKIENSPSNSYMLMTNINISSPISNFSGFFYGNRCTISGSTPFGRNTGTIVYTKSSEGIAQYNSGQIYRCSASGYATYSGQSGGIVGYNSGTIRQCTNQSSITAASRYIGGIAGYNTGNVDNCYHTGSVGATNSGSHLGGIVGYNYGGSINKCYSTGYIDNSHASSGGGIVGIHDSGNLAYCITTCSYYENCAFGVADSAGGTFGNNYYSNGYTSTAYAQQTNASSLKSASFVSNTLKWSNTIWRLQDGSLPKLIWE